VLDPLIEAGDLPNLASLRDGGYSGTLESTFPPITAPAWLSMATGQNPGKTGVFYFWNREDPDAFEFETVDSGAFRGESVWDVLSEQGQSFGVFNFPMLYPPYEFDGFAVSGFSCPEDETITYPEGLTDELDDVVGGYEVKVPYADPKYKHQPEKLAADLHRVLDKRATAMKHLLDERNPDTFFGIVSVTDWAQHYFWRYHGESHVLFDPQESADHDALADLWRRVDEVVGEVAARAEREDATLLIVSDHGFGPLNRTFYSNEWLESEGFRVGAEQSILEKLRTEYFPYLRRVGEPIAAAIPQLNDLLKSAGRAVRGSPTADIDWERSVAFAPKQNLTCGMIYTLSEDPADETAVIEALENLTDEAGKSVDAEVYRPEDLYHGPRTELAPDILFEVEGFECAVDARRATADGVFADRPPAASRSGGHRRDGIYLFAGRGVEGGAGERASLLDVAPTVLYAQGEPIPEVMDGTVLDGAFSAEFNDAREATRAPLAQLTDTDADPVDSVADDPDTDAAKERLEDLGYI
jgi:predicted AlkP superfamily phosphohydrolase/phosphomutase